LPFRTGATYLEKVSVLEDNHTHFPGQRSLPRRSYGKRKFRRIPPSLPKTTIGFDAVRKIGLALPGVEESTAYGFPALKVHGKLLACVPANRSAEPASLVVRVDFGDRAHLLAEAPDVYYLTDHYVGYSAVLVRLSSVTPDVLRDLLGMAYKFVTRKVARRSPSGERQNSGLRKKKPGKPKQGG
jgi:hypothetical protein